MERAGDCLGALLLPVGARAPEGAPARATYIYIYIYIHTHTHTYTYIYIYIHYNDNNTHNNVNKPTGLGLQRGDAEVGRRLRRRARGSRILVAPHLPRVLISID